MTTQDVKRRILYAQYLTAGEGERPPAPPEVCRALNGVQAQYLSNAQHAVRIRCCGALAADWAAGLAKSWTVRGTMHLFAESDLPLFLHRGRCHFLRPQDTLAADDWVTAERKERFAARILQEIEAGRGDREELKAACAAAGMTEAEAQSLFEPWGGILRALAEQGQICYQVQEKKVYRRCPPFAPMAEEEARVEQARRYFTRYGPATVRDAAYYFGAPQSKVRGWMAKLPLQTAVVDGAARYWLPLPGEPEPDALPEIPECVFLAGFDPLLLGYEKKESLFLPPEHLRGVFTLAGIVMPAVLLRGTVVARWKLTGKARLTVSCFRPLAADEEAALRAQAARTFPQVKTVELAQL